MATAPITRYIYFAWVSWRWPSTVGPAAHPRTHVYLLIFSAILCQHHPCAAFFCLLLAFPEVALISVFSLQPKGASLMARMVKNLPAMRETLVQSLGWENPLEKGMATPSSILAWRIP